EHVYRTPRPGMEFHRLRLIRSHETTQPYHGVRVRPTLQTSRIPDPSMRRRVRSGRPLAATEWKPLSEKEFEKLLSLVSDWELRQVLGRSMRFSIEGRLAGERAELLPRSPHLCRLLQRHQIFHGAG